MIKSVLGAKGQVAWIGASDIKTEGNFVYVDGVRATQQNTRWHTGQPDNARGIEDCVDINKAGWPDNSANDESCAYRAFALCEKPILRLL